MPRTAPRHTDCQQGMRFRTRRSRSSSWRAGCKYQSNQYFPPGTCTCPRRNPPRRYMRFRNRRNSCRRSRDPHTLRRMPRFPTGTRQRNCSSCRTGRSGMMSRNCRSGRDPPPARYIARRSWQVRPSTCTSPAGTCPGWGRSCHRCRSCRGRSRGRRTRRRNW